MHVKTRLIFDPSFVNHLTGPGHPEQPKRVVAILQGLELNGLLTQSYLKPRAATDSEILLCHSSHYLEKVKQEVASITNYNLNDKGSIYLSTGDTPICSQSLNVARLAVGAVLEAVDLVMQDKATHVFCIVRPPGHHASQESGHGFCLFNNVAIGARYAQKKYGIAKVLIVDWDVHHGDGTQAIFEKDPSIFYFSTHRYGNGFYPGTGSSAETGVGNILNCPITPIGENTPRIEILHAFKTLLPQVAETFKPDLIMISAGFDAHLKDPLGGFDLVEEDFGELTSIVKVLAEKYTAGRLISVLEGGYHLSALAASASTHVKALSE